MPVKAISRTSIARNGLGSFVAPCHKMTISYCNWGGSSKGIREMMSTGKLNDIAKKNSNIFIEIIKKSGHPTINFHYNNDKINSVDIKNLMPKQIIDKINEYSQRSGNDLFKYNRRIVSNNESVRGIWSPLHETKQNRFKI